MAIRKVLIKGVKYVVSYDEYNVVDTITKMPDNVPMVSTHAASKKIVKNADKILAFSNVTGIEYA